MGGRHLCCREHVDHAVLQGLERSEGGAELLAGLGVGDRAVQQAAHGAHRLGRLGQRCEVDGALQQLQPVTRLAQQCLSADLNIAQREIGGSQPIGGGE